MVSGRNISRDRILVLWFYVIVPIILGFLLGWVRAGRTAGLPLDVALSYWISVSLISTGLLGLTSTLVSIPMRRLGAPLWATLLVGQLTGGLVLIEPAMRLLRVVIRAGIHPTFPTDPPWTLAQLLMTLPSNTLLWIGLNLLFFRVFGMSRFGYCPTVATEATETAPASPSPSPSAVTGDPPFMHRVKPERRGALLALEADGHYLRVFTTSGSDLILYRLADAIEEIGTTTGERVHRSWWVADRAVGAERHRDKLKLENGLEIPVSRSYRIAARRRGWLLGAA